MHTGDSSAPTIKTPRPRDSAPTNATIVILIRTILLVDKAEAGSISITLRLTLHAVTRKWFYIPPLILVFAAPMSASMLTVTSKGKLMVW